MFDDISAKKLSFGEILSMGWKIYRAKIAIIGAIMLIAGLPTILAQFTILDSIGEGVFSPGYFLLTLVGILTSILGVLAVSYVVDETVNGRGVTIREAFNKAFSRWGSSIWTGILCALIILGLSLLLIIPGIIWSGYYIFSVYVVALKGLAGKEALDYSKGLVVGRWWEVFFVNLGIGLITGVIAFPVAFLPSMLTIGALGQGPTSLVLAIITCIYLVIYAFYYVAALVYFLNLDSAKITLSSSYVIDEGKPPIAE